MAEFTENGLREFYSNREALGLLHYLRSDQVHAGFFEERGGGELQTVESLSAAGEAMNGFLAEQADIAPHSTVINIGCGTGGTDRYLAQSREANVIGIDFSDTQLREATERAREDGLGNDITYIQSSMTKIPLGGKIADYVLAQESLYYCDRKAEAVKEFGRVLKDNGLVIVEDTVLKDESARREVKDLYLGRVGANELLTVDEYKKLFHEQGLELVKSADLSRHLAKTFEAVLEFIRSHEEELLEMIKSDSPKGMQNAKAKLRDGFGYPDFLRLAKEEKLGCEAMFFRKVGIPPVN
jgi:sarcosine/dimethylglycine N-methyltransferase